MTKVYYSAMRSKQPSQPMSRQAAAPRRPNSGAAMYGYLLLLAGVAVLLIGYIWEYHKMIALAEDLRQTRLEIKNLNQKNHALHVELATLSTRSRIQKIASQQLGLSYPKYNDVVWSDNPGDRYKTFEQPTSLFAKSDLINRLFSIRAVEASNPK